MALIADDRVDRGYNIMFEGTEMTHTDWLHNSAAYWFGKPTALFTAMKEVIDDWMIQYNITRLEALVGQSAGALFARNVIPQNALAKYGHPFQITFNGFDPAAG